MILQESLVVNRGVNRVDIIAPGVIDVGNYGYHEDDTEPCKWVKACWDRHLADLEKGGEEFPYYFDEREALLAIKFFDYLKQSKGEWAGKPVELMKWQKMILWIVFGWRREDGTRRFRIAWIEVPRKNGKSTFSAGLALLLAFGDGEPGAEVYCVATKRDQAKIVFNECSSMVKQSKEISGHVDVFRNKMFTINGFLLAPRAVRMRS